MLLASVLLAVVAPKAAVSAPAKPPIIRGPETEVSAVTVYPLTERPKLASSYPAADAQVPPGIVILKLTFDQKMSPTFDLGPAGAVADAETPACLRTPRLLNDGKTFVLLCTLRAGRKYALAFNSTGEGGFANATETRMAPATLSFATTRDDPVRSLDEAMKVQGLTGLDVPVQETPGLAATDR